MEPTIAMEKAALRVKIRKDLLDMSTAQRQRSDQAMFEALLALPQLEQAHTVSLFWGVTGLEPNTKGLAEALLERGKTICLPRILPQREMELRQYTPQCPMAMNSFGIWEPAIQCPLIPREAIDLVIVPALCYDRKGFRLGYGGGYFDRWLKGYSGLTVGMCREAVLQDALPVEEHDCRVQLVVTEEQRLKSA